MNLVKVLYKVCNIIFLRGTRNTKEYIIYSIEVLNWWKLGCTVFFSFSSLAATRGMQVLVPDQGWNPTACKRKHGVLSTEHQESLDVLKSLQNTVC